MSKKSSALLYTPWSPSKAGLASTCPLAFKNRYVDKLAGGERSAAAKIGVTVHRAQELHLEGTKVGAAVEQSLVEYEKELTEKEKEKVKTFAGSIEGFSKRINKFTEQFPAKEISVECSWAIDENFEPCAFDSSCAIIRGIVDLSLLLENGYVIIIDHKSGRVRPVSYYRTQLDFYAIMALSWYPDLKGVQCAINFLAVDEVSWATPISKSHIRDILRPWLIKYLRTKADIASTFEPKTGRHCSWCDYRQTCPVRGEDERRSSKG